MVSLQIEESNVLLLTADLSSLQVMYSSIHPQTKWRPPRSGRAQPAIAPFLVAHKAYESVVVFHDAKGRAYHGTTAVYKMTAVAHPGYCLSGAIQSLQTRLSGL